MNISMIFNLKIRNYSKSYIKSEQIPITQWQSESIYLKKRYVLRYQNDARLISLTSKKTRRHLGHLTFRDTRESGSGFTSQETRSYISLLDIRE